MRSHPARALRFAALTSLLLLAFSTFPSAALHAQTTLMGPNGQSWNLPPEGPTGASERPGDITSGYTGANIPLGTANEPTVAVDPNNPLHVAVSSYFQIRVSIDGGATFLPAVSATLPVGFSSDGDASLGFDSQGRLFWVYLGRGGTGRDDIFIARHDPTTGAIMPGYPVNVTAGAGLPSATPGNNHDKEWLAVDIYPGSPNRDNLYVSWCNFPGGGAAVMVYTTRSTNQGMTWSPRTATSTSATTRRSTRPAPRARSSCAAPPTVA
jgi:hypothetical protein